MDSVKKDLREKMEKLEKTDKEKKKNDNLDIVKTERDFFRQEAIRLNELCKELSNSTDDLMRENIVKAAEIKHLTKKWKESEHTNKQLLTELEGSIRIIKNHENQNQQFLKNHEYYEFIKSNNKNNINNNTLKNNNNNYNSFINNSNNNNFIKTDNGNYSSIPNVNNLYNSFENSSSNYLSKNNKKINSSASFNNININNSSSFNIQNNSTEDIDILASNNYNSLVFDSQREKERIIFIIEKLRAELKKEKNRNQKIIGEFNKILIDKKKLENIFTECVEESRKEILQRKMKDTMHSTKTGFFGFPKNTQYAQFPILNEIQFQNFLATDKRKLIENFLMRDEIINFIKENLSCITAEQKGPFLQKNLNESIFSFRQTKNKFDSKLFRSGEFSRSKNASQIRSSASNLEFI